MARPPGDVAQRLIKTARTRLPETGFSGLKVRDVCRKANVNLGLFHYHFKTKERFLHRLLQESYEVFFTQLSLESSGPGTTEERLGRALGVFGRFIRDNRNWILLLLREVMSGHPEMIGFVKKNVPRHANVIAGLIIEGQKNGRFRKIPLPTAMSFAMGAAAVPAAVAEMLRRAGVSHPLGMVFSDVETALISDDAINERITMILAGLKNPAAKK